MSDGNAIVEKTVYIPAELAARLNQLAQAQHVSENELISKALDIFFSLAPDASLARRDWTTSSESAFSRAWDNDQDARYDNWRELYGVPTR